MINDFRFLISLITYLMLQTVDVNAQELNGAWKLTSQNGKPFTEGEVVKIYSDNYFMFAHYGNDGSFINAGGGNFKRDGNNYTEILDFNTADSTKVRQPMTSSISVHKDELQIDGAKEIWKRIDNTSTYLKGGWRFGARVDDEGKAGERRMTGPRQTIKVLSGKYFQWAAFNYETKRFMGTGGGEYSIKDNQYTESIRFFSRDNSKVGISLTFEYRLDGTDWYHKGKGTTGNPVSEVWERMK